MITDSLVSNHSPAAGTHPSNSAVQRKVELGMLHRLGEQHPEWQRSDWTVTATKLALPPSGGKYSQTPCGGQPQSHRGMRKSSLPNALRTSVNSNQGNYGNLQWML